MRLYCWVQSLTVFIMMIALTYCVQADENVSERIDQNDSFPDLGKLIDQLGDTRYPVRQQASVKLLSLGYQARPALMASMKSLDLEVRLQVRRLVASIDEQSFLVQLDAFVTGEIPIDEKEFPAWSDFCELAGIGQTSRRLFAEMQKTEHQLLKIYVETPAKAGDALWSRCDHIQRSRNLRPVYREELSPGRIAALLLVASDQTIIGREKSAAYLNTFCNQEPVRRALSGEYQRAMRAVLGAWIGSANAHSVYHALRLALRFNLDAGLIPSEQILIHHAQSQKNMLQYALLTIGKLGDARHIPMVEKLLGEETRCAMHTVSGVNYRTEVRDVALACLFHLAELDPAEMGFSRLERNLETLFTVRSLGFSDDAQREAVLQKWRQVRIELFPKAE